MISTSLSAALRRIDPRWTLSLTLFAILDALCYPLITSGLRDAPHLTFAFLRAVIAGSLLGLAAVVLGRPMPRGIGAWLGLAGIGLGTTSLGFVGMFHASEFVAPGTATIISHTQPFIAAILAYWFLGERLPRQQRLGLLLAFVGIVVISLPQLIGNDKIYFAMGLAYIVLATIGVSVGNVLTKALGGCVDPLVGTAAQLMFGAIPLAIAALWQDRPAAINWSPTFVVSLLGLAVLSTALARCLWFALLEQVPLSRANGFTFLSPLIAIALGAAFYGESVGVSTILGMAFTVCGVFLVEARAYSFSTTIPRSWQALVSALRTGRR